MKKLALLATAMLLLASCAKSLKPIYPEGTYYHNNSNINKDLKISYSYGALDNSQNFKYSKFEKRSGYNLMTVKIVNHSDSLYQLNQNNLVVTTNNGASVPLINPIEYCHSVKQKSGGYLAYGLLGIGVQTTSTGSYTSTEIIFNPLPLIGGIVNTIIAETANNNLKQQISNRSITNMSIPPKSTVYGYLIVPNIGYQELNFKLK